MGKKTIKIDAQLKPLQPFLQKIKQKFHPQKIILFGSRVKGEALRSSDYDLLLVSAEFSKQGMYQRMVQVYNLQAIPLAVDVLCLTPQEFKDRKRHLGIVQEALKEGIDITGSV